MATLQYDISVLGQNKIDAALAGIERRVAVHNRRVTGSPTGRGGGAARTAANSRAAAHERRLASIQAGHERKLEQRTFAEKQRNEARLHRQKLRNIEAEAQRELAATRKANALAASSRRTTRGAVGRAGIQSVAGVGRSAAAIAGIGGTALIASGVSKQMNVERQAAALANKAFGTPGETRSREEIMSSLMTQSRDIGNVTGDRAGVIQAIDKFVAISGSLKGGQSMARFMADVSDATGAESADVGRTAGQILQNIVATKGRDLSDPEQFRKSMEETQNIMAAMAGQAKVGSIEFADLATQMGKVMSATSRFEGGVDDLAIQMGAIAQLAIAGGASSPEEAMTAIMRFSDDLVQNSKRFEKLAKAEGLDLDVGGLFTDQGRTKLRDPTDIMMDIMRATKGDLTKAKNVFGIRSMKAFEPFQQAFVSARQGGATEEEALAQAQASIDRIKGQAMTREEVGASSTFARTQTGRSFQIVWERMTTEVGEQMLPALQELAPALKDLGPMAADLAVALRDGVPYLQAFLQELRDNPLGTIGKLIAAKVLLDIGRASIGQAISSAISGQVAASGVAGSMGQLGQSAAKSSSALSGMIGPIGLVTAAVLALVQLVNDATAGLAAGQKEKSRRGITGTNLINEAEARLRSGKALTPEQRKALVAERERIEGAQQGRLESLEYTSNPLNVLRAGAASFGLAGGPTVTQLQKASAAGDLSEVDIKNMGEIAALLQIDAAERAATAKMEAAAAEKLSAAADKLGSSAMPRDSKQSSPVP
jgi:hypothetical protein